MSKVTCQVCGHNAHDLRPHFIGGSKEACSVTLSQYQERFPDAPICSEAFKRALEQIRSKKAITEETELTLQHYDIEKTFGVSLAPRFTTIEGFAERTNLVPEIDPNYKFPPEATKIVLLGLLTNKPTMCHGPTGSGKSTLVEQIAARINRPTLRINHHADMYSYDIVGQMQARDGKTFFLEGPLPFAMQRPVILILDEWDALNAEVALQYQPVLERHHTGRLGNLILTADGARKVQSHSMFRIVATSNTCGLGDEKGLYQGTQVQNLAFINRFLLKVRLDYLDKTHEKSLLKRAFPELDGEEAKGLAEVARLIRERFEAGEINVPFSVRDLLNWAEMYLLLGSAERSIKYTCSSILPFADAKVIGELVQRVFGSEA